MAANINTPDVKTDGKKREATSPPITEDTVIEKKTRHTTGDGANALAFGGGDFDVETQDEPMSQDGSNSPIHILSQSMDLNDIVRIARELRSLMLPEVKSVVKEAVREATAPLQTQINNLKSENETLKSQVVELEKKVAANESNIDSLEQYGRRNILRISGIPEDPNESTDTKVLDLATDLNLNLFSHDIDRSHRVGKPIPGKTRDIIVKFSRYNARRMLYEVRKDLREVEDRESVFINEDLTKRRSKLLYDARILVRANHLTAAYSSDGKLFVRDKEEKRHAINSDDDLREFGDVTEAKKELDRQRAIQRLRARAGPYRRAESVASGTD